MQGDVELGSGRARRIHQQRKRTKRDSDGWCRHQCVCRNPGFQDAWHWLVRQPTGIRTMQLSGMTTTLLQKYDLPDPQSIFEITYFKENPSAFYLLSKEMWAEGVAAGTTSHCYSA